MTTPPIPSIPRSLSRRGAFVRLITHDVRNGLNAIDLQSLLHRRDRGGRRGAAGTGKLREMVSHVTRGHAGAFLPLRRGAAHAAGLPGARNSSRALQETRRARKFESAGQANRMGNRAGRGGDRPRFQSADRGPAWRSDATRSISARARSRSTSRARAEDGAVVFEVRQPLGAGGRSRCSWGARAAASPAAAAVTGSGFFTCGASSMRWADVECSATSKAAGEIEVRLGFPVTAARANRPACMNKIWSSTTSGPILLTLEALLKRHGYAVQVARHGRRRHCRHREVARRISCCRTLGCRMRTAWRRWRRSSRSPGRGRSSSSPRRIR